jgi:GNAT superfamily N-acetyltransferase
MVPVTDTVPEAALELRLGLIGADDAGELLTLRLAAAALAAHARGDAAQPAPAATPAASEAARTRTAASALAQVKAELADPGELVLGAWHGQRLVGSIAARLAEGRAELHHFAVVPDLQGHGLGVRVLLALPGFLPEAVTEVRVAGITSGADDAEALELTLASLRHIAAKAGA